MGQYFSWINVDKHERLNNTFWNFAPTLYGRCFTPCEENQAMLSLLATRWKGDVVVFYGDYADFSKAGNNPGCKYIQDKINASGLTTPDFIYETRDATGNLRIAKSDPKNSHGFPEGKPIDYCGPFDVEIKEWRYVVNPARREYIDYQRTPVVFISTSFIQRYDPLPLLLASETRTFDDPSEEIEGRWLGDVVYPTDENPGENFSLIADGYVNWMVDWPVLRGVTDDEVREMIAEAKIDLDAVEDEDLLPILLGQR